MDEYRNQIQRKFQDFTATAKQKIQENEQEQRHVQREVDSHRTEKTGIESEMSLKEKEKIEIQSQINELRKKIKQVNFVLSQ